MITVLLSMFVILASVSIVLEIVNMVNNWSWLPLTHKGE